MTTADNEKRSALLQSLGLEGTDTTGYRPFTLKLNGEPAVFEAASDGNKPCWRMSSLMVDTQLEVFEDEPAFEYRLRLTNNASSPSAVVSDFFAFDTVLPTGDSCFIVTSKGSCCEADDFILSERRMSEGDRLRLTPRGGRSSNGIMPYICVEAEDGGYLICIGWTGQWQATFTQTRSGLHVTCGLEYLSLYLEANEHIPAPRMLLIAWKDGNRYKGYNILRRLMSAKLMPRKDGNPVTAPISHNTAATLFLSGKKANEENQLKTIDELAQYPAEAYWMDAYYFGLPWDHHLGSTVPRPEDFPDGLKPLGDRAHENNMDFVVWFEPERVCKGSDLYNAHPEFLLGVDDNEEDARQYGAFYNPDWYLVDLGNTRAFYYVYSFLCKAIDEYGLDVFRQDFNVEPLPYWLQNDPPNRRGMTEIRYIEGLYALWDHLLAHKPGLVIDNCASGGRRLDIETARRSIPLWRSDYPDTMQLRPKEERDKILPIANQIEISCLNLFMPVHCAALSSEEAYITRSAMADGVSIYFDIRSNDFDRQKLYAGLQEIKDFRRYTHGNFFILTEITLAPDCWFSYQYACGKEGAVLAFRRREARGVHVTLSLHEIPDGDYQVSVSQEPGNWEQIRCDAAQLRTWTFTAINPDTAIYLRYQAILNKE